MTGKLNVLKAVAFAALVALGACGGAPSARDGSVAQIELVNRNVTELTAGILALGAGIDPEEAARAARISYSYTAQLRQEYQIDDVAIIHNIKVNRGTKPRGLCWHWAEDIENRLKAENFQTLDIHRAIANYDNWRLEHSTAIISANGASMYDGMVLDPWREGGELTWIKVREDKRYAWTPRLEVFEWKRARGLLTTRYVQAAGG